MNRLNLPAAGFRYANALAQSCGLTVTEILVGTKSIDDSPVHAVWRGNAPQFRQALWFACESNLRTFETMTSRRWLCTGFLNGYLFREGDDCFRLEITSHYMSPRIVRRIRLLAGTDAAYQRFMAAALAQVALDGEDAQTENERGL